MTDQIDIKTLYYVVGSLVVTNLGTIIKIIFDGRMKRREEKIRKKEKSSEAMDLKLDRIEASVNQCNTNIAKIQGQLEMIFPQLHAIPKLKDDINNLWSKHRETN